jgi:radical SAM protein with 4Fe4S-binding SPASM domain
MYCETPIPTCSTARMREIFSRAETQRVPASGSVDLTYRCNYRCVHCYLGHLASGSGSRAAEMSARQLTELLREASDAGCLLLLLSGGEPLLRADFVEIYRAAKKLGFVVTVFTNASLVSEQHLAVFQEFPPHMVEVSLYGATEATYETITGVPGSFRRAYHGVEALVGRGVRVGIKTMILRDNAHEIGELNAWASNHGLPFRMDPLVTPRLNGDLAPLLQRVEPWRAVEIELDERERRIELARMFTALGDLEAGSSAKGDRVYRCGAGVASFHLDAGGFMHPCLMSRRTAYNAATMGFCEAWEAVKKAVDKVTWDATSKCARCESITLCGYCSALLELEGASPSRPPEYLCRLGEARLRAICHEVSEVGSVGSN